MVRGTVQSHREHFIGNSINFRQDSNPSDCVGSIDFNKFKVQFNMT